MASACSSLSVVLRSVSSARCFAASAAASSRSFARSAVSASTVILFGWISSAPPPTKKCCSSPSGVCTRTSPAFNIVSSGAWRIAIPSSPWLPGANTMDAAPEKISPSALTMSTCTVFAVAMVYLPSVQRLGLLDRFFDRADQVERLLRQVIVVAREDSLEAADGVGQRDDLAVLAREHLRDVERLRQEAAHLARAEHGLLVFFAELVHAEDRDDVLQFLVTLQHGLDAASGVVVLFADDQRIELAARRVERIHRGVDAERRDLARQHDRRVQVGERRRRGRIGQVVGRNVHGLDRRDGARLRRGDALL